MLSAAGEASEKQAKKEIEVARQQGHSMEKLASEKGVTKKSGFTVAREVLSESGVKGLFRGGILRAEWMVVGSGLYLGVYESGRVYLGRKREDS